METRSRHVLIEFWGCNDRINDPEAIDRAIREGVEAIGATILSLQVHSFRPQGVTGLAMLAESHFSIHTWPEHGYVAADIFTCGEAARPQAAVTVLRRHFAPAQVDVRQLERGLPPPALPPRATPRQASHRRHAVGAVPQVERPACQPAGKEMP